MAMKLATSSSDTLLAIVIDSTSETAAKTMQNGNTTKISASSIDRTPDVNDFQSLHAWR